LGSVFTLTFSGDAVEYGSLADGRYILTILASHIDYSYFDGNGDGIAGDDYTLVGNPAANKLFRLFGDADGNGLVDLLDYAAFRGALRTFNPTFDYNGDGLIGLLDYARFWTQFGRNV
jgi:hypothetical protein